MVDIPEWEKWDYYIRTKIKGKQETVDIQQLTEHEFRQFICWKLGMVGVKRDEDEAL
jgi:hypothetical protein